MSRSATYHYFTRTCETDRKLVVFQDESRDVASEYVDGRKRYAPWDVPTSRKAARTPPIQGGRSTDIMLDENAGRQGPILPSVPDGFPATAPEDRRQQLSSLGPVPGSTSASVSRTFSAPALPEIQQRNHSPAHSFGRDTASPSSTSATMRNHVVSPAASLHQTRQCIEDPEGALFMQAFVEEVAIWMDSLDPIKHVRSPGRMNGNDLIVVSSRGYYLSPPWVSQCC